MVKAFTPVVVLLFSFMAGLNSPSFIQLLIVSIITLGVLISSVGEIRFSWIGFGLQVVALVSEGARLVMADHLLKELKLDPLSVLYYLSPLSFLLIALGFMLLEFDRFPFDSLQDPSLSGALLFSGVLAFGLNVAVVLLISNTSALVLTLGGIIKDILLVGASVALFGSPVTPLQLGGYSLSLWGMNAYKNYKSDPAGYTQWANSLLGHILPGARRKQAESSSAAVSKATPEQLESEALTMELARLKEENRRLLEEEDEETAPVSDGTKLNKD
jgi:hypothetical protein